jgi:hypothetical protein
MVRCLRMEYPIAPQNHRHLKVAVMRRIPHLLLGSAEPLAPICSPGPLTMTCADLGTHRVWRRSSHLQGRQ